MVEGAFLSVVDSSIRAVPLVAAALLILRAIPRARGADRHTVLLIALGAVLFMPLATRLTPSWTVYTGHVEGLRSTAVADASRALPLLVPHSNGVAAPNGGRSTASGAEVSPQPAASPSPKPRSILAVFALLWLAGSILVAGWLAAGWASVLRFLGDAGPVQDARTLAAAHFARSAVGLPTLPRVLVTDRISVPLVAGWWRCTVLLPASSASWPSRSLEAALLHELAHVKRRDGLAQLVAVLAVVIYWFHPLVWLLSRRLQEEQEAACDELVLRGGADSCAYADQLLALARTFGGSAATASTIMMARPRGLERRVRAILAWTPAPHRGRRGVRIGCTIAITVCALGLAAMRMPLSARVAAGTAGHLPEPAFPPPSVRPIEPPVASRNHAIEGPGLKDSGSADRTLQAVLATRPGICGRGVANEITFRRDAAPASDCRGGPALLTLHMRAGAIVDADVAVGGGDHVATAQLDAPRAAAMLLDAVPALPPDAAARAIQAAAVLDGAEVAPRLLALARRAIIGADAQRMSVVWADIVAGPNARTPLLSILSDESVDESVREQVLIVLGAPAIPEMLQVVRASPSQSMRRIAAHRFAVLAPVDELLRIYPTLADASAREALANQIAARGTDGERERFAALLDREPDADLRAKGLARLGRS